MVLFENLKSEFDKHIGLASDEEVFLGAIVLYPALSIAYADGIVDSKEREYMAFLSDSYVLHNEDIPEEIKSEKADELFCLLEKILPNLTVWENKFLAVLKDFIQMDKGIMNSTIDMMHQVARVSDGLSSIERDKISTIKQKLGI